MPLDTFSFIDNTVIQGELTVQKSPRGPYTGVSFDNGLIVSDGFGNLIANSFIISGSGGGGSGAALEYITANGAVSGQDSTLAINKTITQVQNAGGGIVVVPPGLWIVSSPVIMTANNVSLLGYGWASIIQVASGKNCYAIQFQDGGNGITGGKIADLVIDGNCANQTSGGGCVDAHGAYLYTFDRCWFKNPWEAGLLLHFGPGGNFGFQNVVDRCQFTGGYLSSGVGRGLWIVSTDENHIRGCHFQDNGGASANDPVHVRDENGLNDYIGCDLVGNGHGGGGIKLYSTNGSRIMGTIFDGVRGGNVIMSGSNNNIVDNCRFLNIGFNAASPNTADGVYSNGVGNIISNNFFNPEGSGTNGCKAQVELDGTNGEAYNIVTSNYFSAVNSGGSNLLIDGSPTGNVSANNIMR